MTNIRSVLVELGTPRQFVTPSNEGRFTVNKLLFAAAALLAASTAPMAHAVDFNVSGVFGSNTGSYSSVEMAIQTYAMAPTNANYEAILGLITSTGLGTTLSVSDSVSALTPTLETQAGGIHLTNNAQFTASGIVLTEYVDSVFSFNYGSIGIFIADAGSSYNFSGNIGVSGGSYSTLGTVFRSNYSTLMFNNATFSNNDGVLGMGGAINSVSAGDWMTFTNVTFTGNTSGNGGAIYKTDGRMAIAKSLFSANGSRQNEGGAISNNSGPLTIVDTSFRQNVASGIGSTGGAIATAEGSTIATNTIFSGNQVTGENSRGGAILIYYGTVDFTDVVFSGNAASGDNARGGAIHTSSGRVNLNVSAGKASVFQGNMDSSGRNSICTDLGSRGTGAIAVTTALNGTLYMFDPINTETDTVSFLTKSGEGTWKLAGTNTLTDLPFTVNGGTLHLYGSNETEGAIHIENIGYGETYDLAATTPVAGVLAFTSGNFTLKDGAHLVFGGTGTALTTTGYVTLEEGSVAEFAIVTENDHGVIKADNLTIEGGTLLLDLSEAFISVAHVGTTLTLFTESASFDPKLPSGVGFESIRDLQGLFAWEMDAENGQLRIVPEPSTYALIGAVGALGLALLRRRRKK